MGITQISFCGLVPERVLMVKQKRLLKIVSLGLLLTIFIIHTTASASYHLSQTDDGDSTAVYVPLSTYLPLQYTETPTPLPTATPTQTPTPAPSATPPLITLTPPIPLSEAFYHHAPAEFSANEGWSCDDFPCEDDLAGFMARIRVPDGYLLSHVGQFDGQPMQITYGRDGRLYATVITEPALRIGAVYALNADGTTEKISRDMVSPVGLAFQPETDVLYVTSRLTVNEGGALWRVDLDGTTQLILDNLPCCYDVIDNQPNGLVFGADGYLYMGVGALTDHAEPPNPRVAQYAELQPMEASILRIQPHTREITVYAQGIRNPYGLTFDSFQRLFVTDNGMVTGAGDRLLQVEQGAHYGWPYWRNRGCDACPIPWSNQNFTFRPDLWNFSDYTLPRGVVAYTGHQFPANLFNSVFVALWHNAEDGQRVVRFDTNEMLLQGVDYQPEPFITGLIRPVDVAVAPDGALVVADFIYGHVWAVHFDERVMIQPTSIPQHPLFVTSTPRPQ
jgi:glucose/arabinose dehydrogenase